MEQTLLQAAGLIASAINEVAKSLSDIEVAVNRMAKAIEDDQ